jgi:hypothetical protein
MSRGPGIWQRQILRATSGTVVATVSGVVRSTVVSPDRDDFTAARRGAKLLVLAERVAAVYVWACVRCSEPQDTDHPHPCCGTVRPMLACVRPERRRLIAHPTSLPGGRVPSWVNVVPPPRPLGQLPVPDVDDLANLVLWRCFERVKAGGMMSIGDAVAFLRLAREMKHDEVLAERDTALADLAEAKEAVWDLRAEIIRRHGWDEWRRLLTEAQEKTKRDRETR